MGSQPTYICLSIGNFNGWNHGEPFALRTRWDSSGYGKDGSPTSGVGEVYKYYIISQNGQHLEKSDPFALWCEVAPRTASIVCGIPGHEWNDADWMKVRKEKKTS